MTNDELWEAEINNLRDRVTRILRAHETWPERSEFNQQSSNLHKKLVAARRARWERKDYLTWKLTYE